MESDNKNMFLKSPAFKKAKDFIVPFLLAFIVSNTVLENGVMLATNAQVDLYFSRLSKVMAGLIFVYYIPQIFSFLKDKLLLSIIAGIFVASIYIFFRSSRSLDPNLIVSSLLFLVFCAALNNKARIYIFSVMLLLLLMTVVLSPGIVKIYTLNRDFGGSFRQAKDILVGISGHYINYGVRCVMAAFIALAFTIFSQGWQKKIIFAFFSLTAFLAGLTCGSRGTILALFIGGLAFSFFIFNSAGGIFNKKNYKYYALIILLIFIFSPWKKVYHAFAARSSFDEGKSNFSERWELSRHGIEFFVDNPFCGIGWQQYRAKIGKPPHSNYIRTFAELGVIGGFIELMLWYLLFRMLFTAQIVSKKLRDRTYSMMIASWGAIITMFCAWQLYENQGLLAGTRLYFISFGVIGAIYLVTDKLYNADHTLKTAGLTENE